MIILKQSKSLLNKVLPIDVLDNNHKGETSTKSNNHDARSTILQILHLYNNNNNDVSSSLPGDSRRNSKEIRFNLFNPDINSSSTSSTPLSSASNSGDESISPTRNKSSRKPSRKNSLHKPTRKGSIKRDDSKITFEKSKKNKHDDTKNKDSQDLEKNAKEVVNELTKFDWILIGIICFLILLIYYF